MAVQRQRSEWDLGKVALVMARIFAYLLYLPDVVRAVLGWVMGVPYRRRLDVDYGDFGTYLLGLMAAMLLGATVFGTAAILSRGKACGRNGVLALVVVLAAIVVALCLVWMDG